MKCPMAVSPKFFICKVCLIFFVAHFTVSKVSLASSTSNCLLGFDGEKVKISDNDSGELTAISSIHASQQTHFLQIVASASSSQEKVKRCTHNLYRLIGQVCFVLQRFSCNLGRTVGLRKSYLLPELKEEKASPLLRSRDPEDCKGNRRFLGNIFRTKQFPKTQKSLFKAKIPSFSSIVTKIRDSSSKETSPKYQYNFFSRRIQNKNLTLSPAYILPLSWGGSVVTEKERSSLLLLNGKRLDTVTSHGVSPWLKNASATDFLRFLRAKNGDVEEAWKMIYAHAKWRTSNYGADTILKNRQFLGSILHRELFWLGESSEGHPTMVIRTQAHDGADYNEDPKIFTRYVRG